MNWNLRLQILISIFNLRLQSFDELKFTFLSLQNLLNLKMTG